MVFEFKKVIFPQELPDILAFDAKVFTLPGDIWDPEDWAEYEVYWMLADGEKVGCCALERDADFDEAPRIGYLLIASIGVLPERRNEGLGTRFTQWQVEYARTHGFSTVVATTRESNAAMIHLYEKLGFEVRCITGYYDEPVERAVVFDLSIAGAS
jgi:ribosomal protein S18 acetylase RimI-like enzyme